MRIWIHRVLSLAAMYSGTCSIGHMLLFVLLIHQLIRGKCGGEKETTQMSSKAC